MKRILFHGTDEKGYRGILENGFNPTETNWTCSDYNCTYFWDYSYFEETEEADEDFVIQRAMEQATIAAALNNQDKSNIYVLRIEVDDEAIEVNEDDNCENMNGAVYIKNEYLQGVEIKAYRSDYYPSLRLFYLSGVYNNRYIDIELSRIEEEAIKNIPFLDELYNFDIEEVIG